MYFFIASLLFLNMATLTKHRILRYESYFSIFCVFAFFPKKHQKKCSKIQPTIFAPKNAKKWSRGFCFGSQNGAELTSGIQQSQKIGKQVCFLAIEFWSDYRIRKKHEKGVPSLLRTVSPYGTVAGCCCQREGGTIESCPPPLPPPSPWHLGHQSSLPPVCAGCQLPSTNIAPDWFQKLFQN